MKKVEFWFAIGSPYTYLSVMRLPRIAAKTGLEVDWRPFSVREIMQEMSFHPYQDKPVRTEYMWKDIARQSRKFGLTPKLPIPFPIAGYDLANRVALVARNEGWIADYALEAYRLWFHEGLAPGEIPNLSRVLKQLGQDLDRVLIAAEGYAIGQAFQAATREARDRGIFDTPSFVVEDEVYWGDDRLPDALRHAIPNPRARVMKKAANGTSPGLPDTPSEQRRAG